MLSASRCKFVKSELKGLVEFYEENESQWKKYIDYKGKHCSAIMTFGAAMYAVNKEADLLPEHFISVKFCKPYYYMGHGFIGDFDTFIYPCYSTEEIYPISKKARTMKISLVNNVGYKFYYDIRR